MIVIPSKFWASLISVIMISAIFTNYASSKEIGVIGSADQAASQVEDLIKTEKYEEAINFGEQWLRKNGARLESQGINESQVWLGIAIGKFQSGRVREAIAAGSSALKLLDKGAGIDSLENAATLDFLALLHENIFQYRDAESLKIRALEIREKALGNDHLEVAKSLKNLAVTYINLARYDRAIMYQLRALKIREKKLGLRHADVALDLIMLASIQFKIAQFGEAVILLSRALEIQETTVELDHLSIAETLNNLAVNHQALGQNEKALPLQMRVLATYEKNFGSEHAYVGVALNNLAQTYRILAHHDKALPLQLRALEIFEKARGSEHPDTALAAINVAQTYRVFSQHEKSLSLQLRALSIYEKTLGTQHPDTALAIINVARTYAELAQYEKAIPLQLRGLTIQEKVLGAEHPNIAWTLNDLALSYIDISEYEKALPLLLRAVEIREKVLGSEHPDTAQAVSSLATVYIKIAQYEKAISLLTKALNFTEKVQGSGHPDTAIVLNNLAFAYREIAQYDKAASLQLRSLKIQEKTLESNNQNTATILSNLSNTYVFLANYEKALSFELRALAIRENLLGKFHPSTALSLGNLASIYVYFAQYDKALPLQLRALEIQENVFGLDHFRTVAALGEVASTYYFLAQYDKASKIQSRVLEITEKKLGLEHPKTALALNNLGYFYNKVLEHEKALALHLRALSIREKVLGPEHPSVAESLNNLAATYSNLAINKEVLPLQLRALAIQQKTKGSDHPDTALSKSVIAFSMRRLGHWDLAIYLNKDSVNIYQEQRENISRIGVDELRSYTKSIAEVYQELADLLIEQGRLAEAQQVLDMLKEDELFEFIRRSKDSDPRRTRISYTQKEARWATRYREVADQLAALGVEQRQLEQKSKLGLTPAEQARLKALNADLVIAEKAFIGFLGEMQNSLVAQGPGKVDEVAATSVQAQRELQTLIRDLGPDVVLLQYYVTNDKVGMLLTTPNVVIPFSSAIDAKALNRQIFRFRDLLRDSKADVVPFAQALYKLLLAPVADALEQAGAQTVMLSLDGNLRHLPFGALHDGEQYVAQRCRMPIYTAVTRDKLKAGPASRWRAAGLGVTRAIGEFKALPAVKFEMDGLLRASGGTAGENEVYLDEKFTSARLKEVGQRDFQLMHISSHFSISPGTEVNSFLLLGDGQRLTLGDIRTQNYRFDNVDLLTLAACDTGLGGGRDTTGKEIEGLGVIAQQQGAKSVLATLWPVLDGSTATLMTDMYQRRQAQGLSKIEALRQAQLALMAERRYSHPFYWAPFILLGNWQ